MNIDTTIAQLEAALAALKAAHALNASATPAMPTLLPQDPRFALPISERPSDLLRQVIAPYLAADGRTFARDFWMTGLVGAQAGASVSEYNAANVLLGWLGGEKPRHLSVLGPDVEGLTWNEVMTSPGTLGWVPAGADYAYDNTKSANENFAAWVAAGAPKVNRLGAWGSGGLPQAYVEETWKHPSVRDLDQPGWPGAGRSRKGKR